MKVVPLRKCVVTNSLFPKEELLRIVKTKDGSIKIDQSYNAPGRGAYISKKEDIILLGKKKNILNKAFRCVVDPSVYDSLLDILKKGD